MDEFGINSRINAAVLTPFDGTFLRMTMSPNPSTDGDERTVRVVDGDRQLAYGEYGDPTGVPVVFLHGTPGSHRLGELFDKAAAERGIRVVAPDRPGYGRSDAWLDRTIIDTGRAIVRVLDDVDVRTAGIIAFSGGAPYALAAAAEHPERVTHVDLISGTVPPAVREPAPTVQRVLFGLASTAPPVLRGLLRGQAWLAGRLGPSFVTAQYTADNRQTPVPEDVAETVRADFRTALRTGAAGTITELRHAASEWEIPSVDVDVRARHGTRDTNVPIGAARRFASRVNARFESVEDADHLGTLRRSVPSLLDEHRRPQPQSDSTAPLEHGD
ncbi:MAG: alpha/beta fold hydrolase [Halobellus sp.]|uniref:alpha/beta fold hydrolase n=1 Tax=Halobellus sp. TaxID=1979212 RepID=UPI0035D46BBC